MLTLDKNGLEIFNNFRIDNSLPKYIKKSSIGSNTDSAVFNGLDISSDDFPMQEPRWTITNGVGLANADNKASGFWSWLKSLFSKIKKIFEPKPKLTIQQFFSVVKDSLKDVETYEAKVNDFVSAAKHAKQMGQIALYEDIMRDIKVVKDEALLLATGFKTVITEEQMVQFYKECEKGLSLTYVKNFARLIPSKVLELKKAADSLLVFDNYVILHYDPKQTAFKLTPKEIENKKDPILFGVIRGSNKLYYIADWIDEYCDLTLNAFIEKFGQEAIDKNNISVNYHKK